MALAGLGIEVQAVDCDPVTVAVATVNLIPFPHARARLGQAEGHDPRDTEGIWLDPARRAPARGGTRRLHDPEEYEPPCRPRSSTSPSAWVATARPARWGRSSGPASPAMRCPRTSRCSGCPSMARCRGDRRGSARWPGRACSPPPCSWTVAAPTGWTGWPIPPPIPAPGPLGDHLYEPDGAVIRAGLIGTLAEQLDARTLDPTIAYLTGDQHAATPFTRGFTVRDVMPFGIKPHLLTCASTAWGALEIKKRGTAVEPEELRRKLRPRRFGDESATLIMTRIAGEQLG